MTEYFYRFDERVAIVTGGSRSIGRALSIALATAGAHVVVNYRHDADAAEGTVSEIAAAKGTAVAVQADISIPEDAQRLVDETRATFGPVSYLINNAAVIRRTPFLKISPIEWNETIATNLTGSFLASQAAARDMVNSGTPGSIVTVSSINQQYARPGLTHYSASKGGASMLTRQLALELAPRHPEPSRESCRLFVGGVVG